MLDGDLESSLRNEVWMKMVAQLELLGRLGEAAEETDKELRLNPDSAYALFACGDIHQSRNELEEAIADWEKAVALPAPDGVKAQIYFSLGNAYSQLKEYDKSKEWCNKIMEVDPRNADALYRIAVIDYDQSISKTGLQGEGIEFLTDADKERTLQDIDEGLKMLDQALQIRPDYFDAMEYQNLLWREKAKFETDEAAKAKLIQQADLIAQKALQLRLKAEEEEAKKPRKLAK